MSDTTIKQILSKYKTVAVVGLSNHQTKPSFHVSAYLQQQGYRIIPVNPNVEVVLGEKSYKSLLDIPAEIQKTIEIVNIFRKSQDVPPIVEQVVKLKKQFGTPLVVWMQLGIVNEEAAKSAQAAGLVVVMDRCLMVDHDRLS
jgi:uncharacterized protein